MLEASVVNDAFELYWGEGFCDGVLLTVEHPNGQLGEGRGRGRGGGEEEGEFYLCNGM